MKTSIREKICDLSGDDLVYCNLNAPDKSSYFNFTRTGADTFRMSDASNNKFCKLDANGNIKCNETDGSSASTLSITKTLL